jgi:catechol 2,3-dioxygenase-like lactoylglutathione lyase family enzyme
MTSTLEFQVSGRFFHLALSLILATPLIASAIPPTLPPPPPLAGIAHAAIRVADLEASRAFYNKLGFEEAFAFDKNGITTQSFIKINDRQFIELYPRTRPSDPIGFMHVCFESTDIDALNKFYLDHGLAPIPVRKAAAGNLLFTLEGPEHQNIEYTQYMPGSRHSNDFGQHLSPTRISTALTGTALDMHDTVAANTFYIDKLAFKPAPPFQPNLKSDPSARSTLELQLPGTPAQYITFIPHSPDSAFRMFFPVDNLNQTADRLKSLNIPFNKSGLTLSIKDPDGNILVFFPSIRFLLPKH